MVLVAPSILSANFAHLAHDAHHLEESGADWLHIDVMDGQFVPNITLGPQVVANLRKESKLFFDVHLMIEKPERMIPAFIDAGADMLTVHCETCPHLHRVVSMIKESGIQAGVALNPATPVSQILEIAAELDLVLIMSVNPGFGGQSFIPSSLSKVQRVRHLLDLAGSKAYLEVDGGVNAVNAPELVKSGCNVLVAGSYIFQASNMAEAINGLKVL